MRRTWTWGLKALWLAATAVGVCACADPSTPDEGGKPAAPAQPAPAKAVVSVEEFPFAPGYVGSDACASCHETEYRRVEGLAALEDGAAGDRRRRSSGTSPPKGPCVRTAEAAGKRIVMFREGDRFCRRGAGRGTASSVRYPVDRTVGNRYKQRYLTKFPDGSWHPLPVQWFEKDAKFVEWHQPGVRQKPGSGEFWADDAWQWQLKCAGCHTTGLDLGYDTTAKTYDTQVAGARHRVRVAATARGRRTCEAGGGEGQHPLPEQVRRSRSSSTRAASATRAARRRPSRGRRRDCPGKTRVSLQPGAGRASRRSTSCR